MDEEEIKRRVIFGTDDSVGYKKPPKNSQFKKGQSGNPKGRPKAMTNKLTLTDNAVLNTADRKVVVRENGMAKELSRREAVIESIFMSAMRGNARSQALAIDQMKKADIAMAKSIEESSAFWAEYKRVMSGLIDAANARGETPPQIIPHPDDIVIDYVNEPRFIGPMDEEGQTRLDHTVRTRDVLIIQDALEHRGRDSTVTGAGLFAFVLDQFIPPRLHLSSAEQRRRYSKYAVMTKPALLKLLYGEWRKLGYAIPRGFEFPDLGRMEKLLGTRIALANEICGLPHPDRMAKGQWEQEAVEIIERHLRAA